LNEIKYSYGIRQKRPQLFVEYGIAVNLSNIRMMSNANTNFVTSLFIYHRGTKSWVDLGVGYIPKWST